jgi:hypothetical protein
MKYECPRCRIYSLEQRRNRLIIAGGIVSIGSIFIITALVCIPVAVGLWIAAIFVKGQRCKNCGFIIK